MPLAHYSLNYSYPLNCSWLLNYSLIGSCCFVVVAAVAVAVVVVGSFRPAAPSSSLKAQLARSAAPTPASRSLATLDSSIGRRIGG